MSPRSPFLPYEVLDVVAQYLVIDHAYGTCANLNSTSRAVKEATLKTLWTYMYWTAYQEHSKYNENEIKAKWDIYKASPGAQYIRYMIEPHLFQSPTGYGEQPMISKSLSATLKFSINLIATKSSSEIQVHLFEKYGYSMWDIASLWRTMNLVIFYPAFKKVQEITICVHSRPASSAMQSDGLLDSPRYRETFESAEDESQTSNDVSDVDPGVLPTLPVDPWLQGIKVQIDENVMLEVDDYAVLCSNIMVLLRPYAMARLAIEDSGEMRPPSLFIGNLDTPVLLAFAASFVRLCQDDQLHTTFDLHLNLAYDEDTGEPSPERNDVFTLLTLLALIRHNFVQASKKISYKLLGSFHASNEPEFIYADVNVRVSEKQLRSSFLHGFDTVINEVDALEDPPTEERTPANA
ncbi:hypothetical protein QFC19_002461 [Naganishia cerealis]|uniref:Uncharacterized protein n=1 Tax=Naganishia cerealis TaxID=610337 RepID=A0ACC2WAG0_9TREE|nr:hypothetical protein QFC19_002461 [Naganishia cerealis]